MKILYHIATLRPKHPKAEAIWQEIAALQANFQGEIAWINPNQVFRFYVPRLLFGFHMLRRLRRRESNLGLHHFYNPDPFPFPYLRLLRRPIVYSITCGVGQRPPPRNFFANLAALAVTDERSFRQLSTWGFDNVVQVKPGIDTARFSHNPLPLGSEIRLMIASAPWILAQFQTKGINALLEAAQQTPNLHLVFLWRGVLAEEIERRVAEMGLTGQVTVRHGLVDVNQILAQVHGSVVLADQPGIVKSYPHSLLDSLAAGKPVLVSQAIPMADYVAQTGCGQVIESVTAAHFLEALEAFQTAYPTHQQTAALVGQRDFSQAAMLESYRRLYRQFT